jgi:sugar O-acyltransferase (sialic acid O-acetyltransferase NeuD family)
MNAAGSRGRSLVIIGTGGLGREALWSLRARPEHADGDRIAGFVTSQSAEHGGRVCDLPVLGDEQWLVGRPDVSAVCAIGDPRARRRLVTELAARGVCFESALDPSLRIGDSVEIGVGSLVGAGAVLTTQVTLGQHAVVGVNAVVSHDCVIEDWATLAPGVILTGGVVVESAAELGAGVSVIPELRIGRGALVGAGSVVVQDVEPNSVVAGNPARVLRRFEGAQVFAPEDRTLRGHTV